MAQKIQLRRDTAYNWASVNPTLAQGEPGEETDTAKMKLGDGSTAWNSLPYAFASASNLQLRYNDNPSNYPYYAGYSYYDGMSSF